MCDKEYDGFSTFEEFEGVDLTEPPLECRTNKGEQLTLEEQDNLNLVSCD